MSDNPRDANRAPSTPTASGRAIPTVTVRFRRVVKSGPSGARQTRATDDAAAAMALLDNRRRLADWRDWPALTAAIRGVARRAHPPINPSALLALDVTPADQLVAARRWAGSLAAAIGTAPTADAADNRSGPLRIGYMATSPAPRANDRLIAALFDHHDRDRFHPIGYGGRTIADTVTNIGRETADAVAARIRRDEIDILVDVDGHRRSARPEIPAFRPAPIQVSLGGYPATTGAGFIDYLIADPVVAPPEAKPFYSEQLVYLPDGYRAYPAEPLPEDIEPDRVAAGLPAVDPVLCCFNGTGKITPHHFSMWMRLMVAAPDSVLWLLEDDPTAIRNLRRAAVSHGIAAARLIFAGRLPRDQHMARYRLADISLDTLPHNDSSAVGDALWAGCPVITMAGPTFAGRTGASQLRVMDLGDLVCQSEDAYIERARVLLADTAARVALRNRIRANRAISPLFDCARFTRHLEYAYATMWARHCDGRPPTGFAVPPGADATDSRAPWVARPTPRRVFKIRRPAKPSP